LNPVPLRTLKGSFLAGAALLAASGGLLRAYDLGPSWPDGNIVMQLQLGQPATPLLDGAPDWATVAESALNEWNLQLARSKFTVVRDSTAAIARGNRINNVIFRTDIYGQAFDSRTLAVTLGFTSTATARATEKDVIFNSNRTWNSYRGTLRSTASDFRRVALHEFGHVLGLDHPDQATPAQFVDAVMNSTVSNVETLRPDDIAGAHALYDIGGIAATPVIVAQPQSRTVRVGDSYTFSVTVNGTGPFTYAWTFRAAGSTTTESFPLATGPSYTIGAVETADAGIYTVTVRSALGNLVSNAATLTVTPVATAADTTLANISTRGIVGGGNGVLIAGIVVGGTTPKNVFVRAAGPALAGFGVAGALTDPTLSIVDQSGATIAQNDNWESDGRAAANAAAATRLGAFQFRAGSRDAALLVTLPPGSYTAVVSGVGAATGVALVEVYDADPDPAVARSRRLVNIATRGLVSGGDNDLIAGLVVTGPGPRTYLIRAVGPTLANAPFNLTGVLNDPFLQLYQGETLLRENDDWDTTRAAQPALRDAATKVGAFPLQVRRDSAMIVTLDPGNYTAKVSGFEGATGVALVEIYEIP
jgi:hypothetical protein